MNDAVLGNASRIGEGLLSTLMDLLPDHFYVADSGMRIVYVNKPLAEYFGRGTDEIVGKTFTEVGHDKDFARRFAELGREVMAADAPRVTEFGPYHEPDGTLTFLRRYDMPFRHPQTGERMVMGLVQDVTDRVERERQERRLAAMDREMQIAREIQRSVLPRELTTDWVELFGFSEPAAYAGGDFYDWQRLRDGSVVVALGDVTGHGVGPAMVAAECRAYWRVLAPSLPLRDAVLRLNELVVEDSSNGRFVTFAAARLWPGGSFELFSAGQGPLVLRRRDGPVELFDSHTFPLGVTAEPLPDADVTHGRLTPGDTLLMFSDGITEARNPQGRQWTTGGLLEGLARHRAESGSDLLRAIDRENLAFADGMAPADDRTVTVATFRGG